MVLTKAGGAREALPLSIMGIIAGKRVLGYVQAMVKED
jgi:hypothetical protein